ncbi:Lsr2 family protein [Glycomyces sp. TRM65418]|uniref:Lsr2 family DNA-binding protein n=1 Tax=Glycomyces sp. TRM65418 TaxID=2867006 RepID=UPI001D16B98C|nr:histone-like nucleoid-structuring protein Lsr2 [Glycomyces sp. TRM65418]MCC3765152.1 Lsr2 family protein [Glycomyces sp. TRM65418]
MLFEAADGALDGGAVLAAVGVECRWPAASGAAPAAAKSAPNRGGKERNRAIRPWGEEHRLPVEVRGKLSDEVITKYDAAHTEPA